MRARDLAPSIRQTDRRCPHVEEQSQASQDTTSNISLSKSGKNNNNPSSHQPTTSNQQLESNCEQLSSTLNEPYSLMLRAHCRHSKLGVDVPFVPRRRAWSVLYCTTSDTPGAASQSQSAKASIASSSSTSYLSSVQILVFS